MRSTGTECSLKCSLNDSHPLDDTTLFLSNYIENLETKSEMKLENLTASKTDI